MNVRSFIIFVSLIGVFQIACKKVQSNGETIFRTGKNLKGETVAFIMRGEVKLASGCQECHGRTGGNVINKDESIKYKDLSNPKLHKVPYNDSLIKRLLEIKVKSDDSSVNSPAITKMSEQDKHDLIQFLKLL